VSKKVATAKKSDFNPHTFLSANGKEREMLSFGKKSTIFAQGDETDGLFFIQEGKVQLSLVSGTGKEATLGILSEGDFFGEGGLGAVHTHVICDSTNGLRPAASSEEGKDARHKYGAKIVGYVHEAPGEAKHSVPGRPGRSTFQLQRKATGTSSSQKAGRHSLSRWRQLACWQFAPERRSAG
jgi:Cyclic nucleotide-binding domain